MFAAGDASSVAASDCGEVTKAPSGKQECKFCRRSDITPNPLTYTAAKYIPWRRQFGTECGICPWVIAHDAELKKLDKKDLAKQLASDDGQFNSYIEKVQKYEEFRNSTGGKSRRSSKINQDVVATASETLEYKKHLGFLWPLNVYEEHFEKKPSKGEVSCHVVGGRKLRGVLLDERHGKPPGVIEVSSRSETSSVKTGVIASSSTHTPEDVRSAWDTAQKRQQLNVVAKKDKEGLLELRGCKRPQGDSSSGDDAALALVSCEELELIAQIVLFVFLV